MAEERESLLLKEDSYNLYYDENCPGCRVQRRKQECPNPPWLNFFFIWIATLCAALPVSSIFPFLYYMIRDFHIAEREEDVSFYAGFEGFCLLKDLHLWLDVMILGSLAVIIFNTLFGLSTSYWMALATRFLLGAFCGILGPIRAYATEVCRREHQSLAMAMINSAWGIGLVIGPAIGGYLAQETLHTHSTHGRIQIQSNDEGGGTMYESDDEEKLQNSGAGTPTSSFSLLRNWPLMSAIIVFCIFQLHDMAYIEIFSLWGVSPRAYGGVGLSTGDIGQALAVSGIGLLVCQLFLYPILERTFGPISVSRVGAVLSIALLSTYPFIAKLSGWRVTLLIDLASALKNVLSVSITTGLLLLQNRAVSQQHRGAANGISLCAMSFCKAIGPASAGTLLSWSETRQNASFLPGSHMVFFILNVVEFVGFVLTFKPFLVQPAYEFS